MPTATSGIYELVLEQLYGDEPVKNVFHYLHTLGNDDEQDLCALAFDEDVMADLAGIINSLMTFEEIRVANLSGTLADASLSPSQGSGDVIGSNMPSFAAASFKYARTTKETRNGAKRFGGLIEENVTGNNFLPAYVTDLDAFAVILAAQISTVGGIFDPIILRKPDIAGVWTYNDVANVLALDRVTTQNSRKAF